MNALNNPWDKLEQHHINNPNKEKEEQLIQQLKKKEQDNQNLLHEFLTKNEVEDKLNLINNVLNSFKLNPFNILNISNNSTIQHIKERYKYLSLQLHPDKISSLLTKEQQELALLAFNKITQAKNDLLNDKKRIELLDIILQAKQIIKEDQSIQLSQSKEQQQQQQEKVLNEQIKELLIAKEWKNRQYTKLIEKKKQQILKEKEIQLQINKNKKIELENWDKNCLKRVTNWRNFSEKKKKKKKKGKIYNKRRIMYHQKKKKKKKINFKVNIY